MSTQVRQLHVAIARPVIAVLTDVVRVPSPDPYRVRAAFPDLAGSNFRILLPAFTAAPGVDRAYRAQAPG